MALAQPYCSGRVTPSRPSAPISLKISRSVFSFEVGVDHTRQELFLRIAACGIADHALVFAELTFEQKRVVPLERRSGLRSRLFLHAIVSQHGKAKGAAALLFSN